MNFSREKAQNTQLSFVALVLFSRLKFYLRLVATR